MKILLTGATGGIGSAIKESLKEHEITNLSKEESVTFPLGHKFDWVIFAHGALNEENAGSTFFANVVSCIEITQNIRPHLSQGVIYISSTAALTANSRFPIYSASKAALNTYAKAMSKAHPELQFYAVCPGPTDTKMWRSLGLEGKAQAPSEVARVVELITKGQFRSGDIITIRDSAISIC